MLLILYSTKSGANVINKTLENPLNVDIIARSDFDIINPEIKLSMIAEVNFNDYNYLHIPYLNRYYFINEITAVNREIFLFECECDVLESYKDDILLSNARFNRSIKTGDYLNAELNQNVKADISTYQSNKTFTGEPTLILSTVGSSGQ